MPSTKSYIISLSRFRSHTHKNTLPFKLLRNWQSLSKHTHTHCLAKLFYCRFFQFFRSPGYGLWPKQLKYQTKTFMPKWVGVSASVSVDVVFILNNRKVFVVEVFGWEWWAKQKEKGIKDERAERQRQRAREKRSVCEGKSKNEKPNRMTTTTTMTTTAYTKKKQKICWNMQMICTDHVQNGFKAFFLFVCNDNHIISSMYYRSRHFCHCLSLSKASTK